jgi:hypothetical protein
VRPAKTGAVAKAAARAATGSAAIAVPTTSRPPALWRRGAGPHIRRSRRSSLAITAR